MKNFLATLLVSQGVPMLLAGDEFARTQKGNNNAYCQDNEISWVDWGLAEANQELLRFAKFMIRFRKRHPALMRNRFFDEGGGIVWHGERENEPDWSENAKWLAFLLDGRHAKHPDGRADDDLYIALNASGDRRHFAAPERGNDWLKAVDTSQAAPGDICDSLDQAPRLGRRVGNLAVEPGSMVILVNPR